MFAPRSIPMLFRRVSIRKSSTHAPVVLRPYQERCLAACIDALSNGSSRIGVSLPTGSGKTTVFISLLSRITSPPENEEATRSLIVVNSIELARQSADQVRRLFPDWSVEIEQGAKHQASGSADVTVATYQTLSRAERLFKIDPRKLKAIIVDEAHHAAAPSYRTLLSRFHPDIRHPENLESFPQGSHKVPVIGFSATFGRHDGVALSSVFESIVYHQDFLEMIKEQWLCKVTFTSVKANLNLKDVTVNSRNGDFNPTSLSQVINTDTMNDVVVKAWIDRAGSTRKSTLVFCVDVAHVRALTQAFRSYGIDARFLYAETPAAQRKLLVDAFKAGEFPVLVNCAILTEGADIPNIDCVLVARPTRSRNIFAQMIGRGMRLSPQTHKEDCHIIDFVDTNSRVGGVVSIPTLFGLDPNEMALENMTTEDLERRAAEIDGLRGIEPPSLSSTPSVPYPASITYVEHDDPFSVSETSDKPNHINALSPYAWVSCGDNIYVLELLSRGFIRIDFDEEDNRFFARYTPANFDANPGRSPYLLSRQILTAESLSEAVRGCDTYAQRIFPNSGTTGLHRSAPWRKKPASDAQKNMIRKRWEKTLAHLGKDKGSDFIDSMNKGDAATIITRLRNGSQARYKKTIKLRQKLLAAAEKEERRRAREVVQVGPLAQDIFA
ncbi:unnamed protein product [Cyclocybe aegerita]|uniref:P-loop containing nucleoside triphosphate hydrolase protein n=1 Tax=Cyclocybe aegerita TaxID=1973307 RepID=A0A8S0VSU1_CYCAE|nr:unnamed protein product [Cyclocybe aegerita]